MPYNWCFLCREMVEKNLIKNAVNTTVSLILFVTYVCFFGQQSIERYLEGKIIITEHEETRSTRPIDAKL